MIIGGQYLRMGILVAFSLFAAFVLNFIPQAWVIGLLGLIPLSLGIRLALKREDPEDENVLEKMQARGSNPLFWTIALITVASGGDNLGIYIPYFTAYLAGNYPCSVKSFANFYSDSLPYQLQTVKNFFSHIRNHRKI